VSAFGRLIPLLTFVIVAFAVFQLYNALVYLAHREYIIGALNLVFSFAGAALATGLWTHRGRFK
jgi:hypothetical protein